jgi:uncharacterized Zn-finger protein
MVHPHCQQDASMSEFVSANSERAAVRLVPANASNHYEVSHADLPLSCPMPGMALWNSHPKVYLAVEATGSAKCPYCGAQYTLRA